MPTSNISKALLLMIALVSIAVVSWELYLRKSSVTIAYDDGPPFWSYKRALVYQPKEKATVFTGTSRMSYDLDIETWKKITGGEPIQLAIVATSPLTVLDNLAADKNFKGNLIIDAMEEGLFFGDGNIPQQYINFYNGVTPAQKASFQINHLAESAFVFLDKDNFSLSAELSKLQIPSRQGVWTPPVFPMEFTRANFDRQHFMTSKFAADTGLQNKVRTIWNIHHNFFRDILRIDDHTSDSIMHFIKTAVGKIRARGGEVLFVKLPSSGAYLIGETRDFPREKYWNRLLEITGCPGIHFMDYPAINHFNCPEWSHLSQPDAVVFTKEFIRILHEEKKWSFPELPVN